jgi:hypothetical protein
MIDEVKAFSKRAFPKVVNFLAYAFLALLIAYSYTLENSGLYNVALWLVWCKILFMLAITVTSAAAMFSGSEMMTRKLAESYNRSTYFGFYVLISVLLAVTGSLFTAVVYTFSSAVFAVLDKTANDITND